MSKDAIERSKSARAFVERWRGRGDEKSDTQKFWIDLLRDVCGVERPTEIVTFEKRVQVEATGKKFIDAYIPATRVLIEQKSSVIDLAEAAHQSDGTSLTPFEQAMRYNLWLPYDERPLWVVVSNFKEIRVHDMMRPRGAPEIIELEDLPTRWRDLAFLADAGAQGPAERREVEVSKEAGKLVKRLREALEPRYVDPTSESARHGLTVLCVRLVFLLYAEDAELAGPDGAFLKDQFHGYLAARRTTARRALIDLFEVLDQRKDDRDPYLDAGLAAFPYVDGGLFEERGIEIPDLDDAILDLILDEMSLAFDWSKISPTIFGSIFEGVLSGDERRAGGMHYTSPENIHRVIGPLFLDELTNDLEEILKEAPVGATAIKKRNEKLEAFRDRLAALTFLDPACGSGNFLTEGYTSLRRLENRALAVLYGGQRSVAAPIEVSIEQFFGIEINDLAVAVARTALWIAEAQMMAETRAVGVEPIDDVLPLKSYPNIVQADALRMDWRELVPAPSFIMGNPPFCGRRYRTPEQIEDVARYFDYKDIDYVACWYKKAADLIQGTETRCAFVSTSSITQGEQVPALWKDLGVHIDFAWRTFRWDSEAEELAHVHVVIIGFSCGAKCPLSPRLFAVQKDGTVIETHAKNINGYLLDAPDVYITLRSKPISDVPSMRNGNVPLDGDALKIEAEDIHLFADCPHLTKRLIGGRELLHDEPRYVLWLVGVSPAEIKRYPRVYQRVEQCRANRLAMKDKGTQRLADTPTVFRDTFDPDDYIALPMVSSERRAYIPMAYFHGDTIPTNQVQIIPGATLYHFGVLTSDVHMAWMRVVAGRLETRYRYSKDIVYNNFVWPEGTPDQREKIERTAQAILDARALFPDSSLADLYDDAVMPPELRKAHRANDAAVRAAYGFPKDMSEPEIVAALMEMWREMAGEGRGRASVRANDTERREGDAGASRTY